MTNLSLMSRQNSVLKDEHKVTFSVTSAVPSGFTSAWIGCAWLVNMCNAPAAPLLSRCELATCNKEPQNKIKFGPVFSISWQGCNWHKLCDHGCRTSLFSYTKHRVTALIDTIYGCCKPVAREIENIHPDHVDVINAMYIILVIIIIIIL